MILFERVLIKKSIGLVICDSKAQVKKRKHTCLSSSISVEDDITDKILREYAIAYGISTCYRYMLLLQVVTWEI